MKKDMGCRKEFGMAKMLALFAVLCTVYMGGVISCSSDDDAKSISIPPVIYTVTIAGDIANGTIKADKTIAEEKATVTLTLTPAAGYEFESLTVKQGDTAVTIKAVTVGRTYTFVMPQGNVTVTAAFKETAETVNKKAADAVIAKINEIGTVSYTAENKAKIDGARAAYNALTETQKSLVTNYEALTTAESTYESLIPYAVTVTGGKASPDSAVAGVTVTITANAPESGKEFDKWTTADGVTFASEAEAETTFTMPAKVVSVTATYKETAETVNKRAADAVIAKINEIGTVSYMAENKAKIDDARAAYNALTETQKSLVTNYEALTTAESTYESLIPYAVTVTGGKASPDSAVAGATVSITANAPESGKEFDKWTTADGVTFASETGAETTFTMPAKAVSVTATYKETAETVNKKAADAVIAKINEIGTVAYTAESKAKIDGARAAYNVLTETQKTLVANYEALTAAESTYEGLITYTITVTGGTANPTSAVEGATVTITANAPEEEKEFDKWTTTGDVTFASETAAETTFTMPKGNVTVTATYKDILYIGSKKPSEAKTVGDIVFTDGSATPYTADLTLTDEQKNAAIAVIFYVGTACSNDTSSRTLGVGLVHGESVSWCSDLADAYEMRIPTIECDVSGVHEEYELDGYKLYRLNCSAEELTFTGDKDGSDNFEQLAALDGVTDAEYEYHAFRFAKNYKNQSNSHVSGTNYESGWYLPTICEFCYIWDSKDIVNAASSLCGGSQFKDYSSETIWGEQPHENIFCVIHWTSSTCSLVDHVQSRDIQDGIHSHSKTSYGDACAIREF